MTFEVSCPAACRRRGVLVRDPVGFSVAFLSRTGRLVRSSPASRGWNTVTGKDHVAVPAAHVDIAEAVVRDARSVVDDPVQVGRGHVR